MKTLFTLPQAVALMLTLTMAVAGCQKKREAKLADGDGRYSDAVSTYDGKVFKVTTHEALGKGGVISSSEEGKAQAEKNESEQGALKTYPAVRYTTEAKLVDAVPFLAKPNTTNVYEIHYELTNSHLLVSKVAKAEFIPFTEQSYAKKLSDGRLSVPLFGYPLVGKVSREVAKNDLGEITSRLVERPVMDIAQASHVQIDFTRFEEFGSLKKVDTFPVEFFTGPENAPYEWYFGESLLNSPDVKSMMVGDSSTFTLFDVRQSLVRFERTQNGLEVVGLAVDKKGQNNNSNFVRAAFIPGEYKEFKVEKEGRFRKMREEEESQDLVHWKKTQYIKLNFANTMAPSLSGKSSDDFSEDYYGGNRSGQYNLVQGGGLKVVKVSLENDFISVILENTASNMRYNLSFLKKKKENHANYKPLIYHEIDNKYFGYYATKAPEGDTNDYRLRRETDLQKVFLINRFNPNNKVIEYHLSNSTPDWSIPGAVEAIETWNKAFQEANTGITVKLNTSKKVDTGDIRYNVINMIDTQGSGGNGLFGYGPVLSDPFTGEVISAVSTIHLHNFRLSILGDIRMYVLSKTGAIPSYYRETSTALQNVWLGMAAKAKQVANLMSPEKNSSLNQVGPFASVIELSTGNKFNSPKQKVTLTTDLKKMTNKEFRDKFARYTHEAAVPALIDNVESDLQTMCPEVISYINKLVSEKKKYDENEISVLEECSNKIVVKALVSTLVHELGHNFGLRHNYGGSADWQNFEYNEKGQPVTNTASIMDYVPVDYRKLTKPGKYDVAAIRYAYAGEVRLNKARNFEVVKLDHNKNIKDNLTSKGLTLQELKPYKFCTDAEAKGLHTDPMCELFDVGWTPEQVVDYWMKEANRTFALGQYKWDRREPRKPWEQASAFSQSVLPMLKFYGHWREKLAEYMQKKNVHLENQTVQSYQKILDGMKNDPNYKEFYKTYQPISVKIYKFLLEYSFLPDYYCLVEVGQDKKFDVIEFNVLRREVYGMTKESIESCSDKRAENTLKSKNMSLVTEFGYSSVDIQKDLSDDGQVDSLVTVKPVDILGTYAIKEVAQQAIALRVTYTKKGLDMDMQPSFFDEPAFREIYFSRLMDRLINGLNPELLLEQPDLQAKLKKIQESRAKTGDNTDLVEKFKKSILSSRHHNEKMPLLSQLIISKAGLSLPNVAITSSQERLKPFGGTLIDTSRGGPAQGATELINGLGFSPDKDAHYAIAIINKYVSNKVWLELNTQKVNQALGFLKQIGFPETSEQAKKMTVGDIRNMTQQLQALSQKIQEEGDEELAETAQIAFTIVPEIEEILRKYGEYMQTVGAEFEKDPENQKITDEEEMKKKVNALLTEIGKKSAMETLKGLKPHNLQDKIKTIQDKLNEVKKNGDEMTAQQDLMLLFLLN